MGLRIVRYGFLLTGFVAASVAALEACKDDDAGGGAQPNVDGGGINLGDGGGINVSDGGSSGDSGPGQGPAPGPNTVFQLPIDTILTIVAKPDDSVLPVQESAIREMKLVPALEDGAIIKAPNRVHTFRTRVQSTQHGDGRGIPVWWTTGDHPNIYICSEAESGSGNVYSLYTMVASILNDSMVAICGWELIRDPTASPSEERFALRSLRQDNLDAGQSYWLGKDHTGGPQARRHLRVAPGVTDPNASTYKLHAFYSFRESAPSTNIP